MLRIFTSTLRRSARSVLNNTHPERFALQSLTYAQSKFWKTEVHQNKPVSHGQENTQASQSQASTSSPQDNRVVIVRGLPQNWVEGDISVYFDKNSTSIQKVNLIKNRVGGNTGKALITFNSADNAESFISKWDHNTIQAGELNQIINAQVFTLQKKEEPVPEAKTDLRTVFVSNLAFNCTSDDLHNFASDFGEIVGVEAPMTANNKTKGFAFITFKEAAEAQKFLAFAQEKDLLGRKLRVQLSKPRTEGKAAKKTGHTNFGFSTGEGEESRTENFGSNTRLYKDLSVGKGKSGSHDLRVGRSIANKNTGAGFDI